MTNSHKPLGKQLFGRVDGSLEAGLSKNSLLPRQLSFFLDRTSDLVTRSH